MVVLLQLRILGFGLLEDGDVGIGVLPKGKKILIRLARRGAVAGEGVGASQTKVGQRCQRIIDNDASVIDEFLKLDGSEGTLTGVQLRNSSNVNR